MCPVKKYPNDFYSFIQLDSVLMIRTKRKDTSAKRDTICSPLNNLSSSFEKTHQQGYLMTALYLLLFEKEIQKKYCDLKQKCT